MIPELSKFESFFKVISYGTSFGGLLCLFASGSISAIVFSIFLLVIIISWFLESSKWQFSERFGVILIVLIIPIFYLDWKYHFSGFSSRDAFAAGSLSILILTLSSIKLLQKKIDRDWVFIYLISFFEVLLAAGVSISPLFLSSLVFYLLIAFTSIILFDIRKTSRIVYDGGNKVKHTHINSESFKNRFYRLPITALSILLLISIFAVPLFFAFPRFGGAGFGSGMNGLSGFTGFSDSVRLGEIGKLQQSNEIVMRVRMDKSNETAIRSMKWRGVALDYFDKQTWKKSKVQINEPFIKNERDFFLIDGARDLSSLSTQTIYLEPIDTPILFALARPIALQGNFQIINKDAEGSINTSRNGSERITYKVYSDTSLPKEKTLREDNAPYTTSKYLQLPEKTDPRISNLAKEVIKQSGANNRYDQAKAIEHYLQTNFSYTLDLKAGGEDPLADFLFNVKEGHCEYFASAMAIMLRTQGISTRIVNGFQTGEYNETADIYVVRQKEAHSWVEVYFPTEKVWVPFDPTASSTQTESAATGFTGKLNKYLEALETFWIQYVVSYDNQEQRSLFKTVQNNFVEYQNNTAGWLENLQSVVSDWWENVRGQNGIEGSFKAIAIALGYLLGTILGIFLLLRLYKKLKVLQVWQNLANYFRFRKETSIVEFYERMQRILEKQGFKRESWQTPLEFAMTLNMPEAVKITEKYNRVRLGDKKLSQTESKEIENWLEEIEKDK